MVAEQNASVINHDDVRATASSTTEGARGGEVVGGERMPHRRAREGTCAVRHTESCVYKYDVRICFRILRPRERGKGEGRAGGEKEGKRRWCWARGPGENYERPVTTKAGPQDLQFIILLSVMWFVILDNET